MSDLINDMLFGDPAEKPKDENEKSPLEAKVEFLLSQGFTRDNIEMKSDLSAKAIRAIAKGKMHAQIFNDSLINDFCDVIMILNISKDRKGRVELTDLTKMLMNEGPVASSGGGMLSRLMGG